MFNNIYKHKHTQIFMKRNIKPLQCLTQATHQVNERTKNTHAEYSARYGIELEMCNEQANANEYYKK